MGQFRFAVTIPSENMWIGPGIEEQDTINDFVAGLHQALSEFVGFLKNLAIAAFSFRLSKGSLRSHDDLRPANPIGASA